MFKFLAELKDVLFCSFLKKQLRFTQLGMSVIFLSVTTISMPFITMLFAGQLGQSHLDGVGLSNTMYNIVVTSVWFGYSTVFDTYAPQVISSRLSLNPWQLMEHLKFELLRTFSGFCGDKTNILTNSLMGG